MAPKRTSPTKGARATAAAAAAARAPTLTAEGNSDSWESSKANQFRIANKFLEAVSDEVLKDKWGLDWEKLPEEHACSPEIYQALASYLCQEYIMQFRDLLISKCGASSMIYKSGEPLWLCPSTQGSGAGAKLTSFVAGMQPAGCSGHLSKYAAAPPRTA